MCVASSTRQWVRSPLLTLADSSRWSKLDQSGSVPPNRAFHTACSFGSQGRVVVFGGRVKRYMGGLVGTSVGMGGFVAGGSGGTSQGYCNDTFFLEQRGASRVVWKEGRVSGELPPARESHTMCVLDRGDETRGLIVFGGGDGARMYNDVWMLPLIEGTEMRWRQLQVSGDLPCNRSGACHLPRLLLRTSVLHFAVSL